MNHTAMRARASLYLDDSNNDLYTTDQVTSLLNAAQQRLQKIIDAADEMYFSGVETYVTVADDDAYEFTLPTDCRKVILVEVATSGAPVPCEFIDFRKRHEGTFIVRELRTDTHPILYYYMRGNKLGIIRPSRAHTIKLWYTKLLPNLVSDSDTSEIPTEYHDLLCMEAAKRACGAANKTFPVELAQLHQEGLGELQAFIDQRVVQGGESINYIPE